MENRLIKILAIDDNPDNLITIQALINEAYPKVIVLKALNGINGIKIATDENPDVILLDIVMPEMDGYEVCRRLKADKNLIDIPVIFVTAIKGDKESRIKALECGAEAFLAKPIDESELIAQIRAMVKIKSAHLERQDENVRLAALVAERTLELKKTHTATLNLLEDLKNENEARKKTEAALRESEELYRSVLNASPDDITVTDLEGKILMVSPVGIKLFGYTNQNEIIGKKATDFIISNDRERSLINLSLMINGQYSGPEEYRLIKADGSEFDSEINTEFVRDENGNPSRIVYSIRDITERKQAQESLKESEEKFREMTNLLPQVVFELDMSGNITYLNQKAYNIFGYEENEMIGQNSLVVHIPEERETVLTGFKQRLAGIEIADKEFNMIRKDGSVFPALIYTNTVLKNKKTVGLRGIIIDITQQKLDADKIRESEEKFRDMANLLPQMVFETDFQGNLTYLNKQAYSLFRYNENELIGLNSLNLHLHEERIFAKENIRLKINGIQVEHNEYTMIRKDGSTFPSLIYTDRIIKANKTVGLRGILIDITEQKLSEEKIRESEEKFREMANLLPQIVFETDIQGNITYVNRQAYKICGYSEDEDMIGTNSINFYIPEDRQRVVENIKNKYENKPFGSSFYTITRKNGTTFPALVYSNPVIKDFKPVGLRGIIVDITEQKIAEEKISHVARLYALLSQINQAITRTQGKYELYQTICEIAVEFGQFQMAWVGMYNDSSSKIIPISWAGNNDEYLDQIIITTGFDIYGVGPTGTAFREGKITVCNDIATDPMMLPWRDEALKRGYKSAIAIPFVRNEQIIGTLSLYASESDFFSVDELKLMKELGEDISFALNAFDTENLRNQTEKELEQSRNELKTIYDHAPVMMCVVDTNRNVLFANQAFSSLTGISEIEMIGGAVGNVVGCINSLLDPRGCGFGPNCWNCSLRMAMEKTFSTGIGIRNIDYQSTLKINGLNNEVSLLGSTAIITNEDKKSLLLCLHDITDRKLAEEALQKSEMLLRTFIENSPFEIWARDMNNVGILENKKSVDHYGSIIGKKPKDVKNINLEINHFWNTTNHRVLEGEIVDEEFEHYTDNSKHIYQQIAFPINNNEKTIGIAGFNIDITESKKIEEALRQNNSRLELAMQISNMSWWEMDTITGNVLFGKRKTEMLGYTNKNFVHYTDFTKLVHPDDYKPAMSAMRNLINGEKDKYEIEYRILNSTGQYRWFYDIGSISKRDANGEPLIVSGLVMDITERKEVENELSDQKQFFEQMFMQSSISTQILDREGWCERINPKLSEIFGVEANSMEGKVYNIFKDKEIQLKGLLEDLENVFKNGKTAEWEVLFDIGVSADSHDIVVADKKKAWFSNWAYPIFDQQSEISHVIIQHNDITDRKMAEEALSESQEQLKKFAAHLQNVREEERVLLAREIHDELGQILIAIKIDMGMLKQNVLKGIDKKHTEQVLTKFDVLFGLVDNTIKTARKIMTDLRPEVLDLLGFTETIKQHLKTFQDRFNILCVFDNSVASIELDSQKSVALFRIIQEALNNIAKHARATKVIVTMAQNENQFSLEIVDNGIGFDDNNKKNPDSYGLIGMKERVFLLDGELTILSKKNIGTTIKVVMPYLASSIEK